MPIIFLRLQRYVKTVCNQALNRKVTVKEIVFVDNFLMRIFICFFIKSAKKRIVEKELFTIHLFMHFTGPYWYVQLPFTFPW